MNPDLHAKVIKVIKPLIPPDAEDRVARTVRQANAGIRDVIRSETGLRLSDEQTKASIPVKVTEGFPERLAELIGKHDDPVLWRIIAAQSRLGGVIEGLQFLLDDWAAFEQWPHLPEAAKGSEEAFVKTVEAAGALQTVALSKQVTEELKAIHEDILGSYHFRRFNAKWKRWEATAPWVEIYWMPVALISAILGVRIEDLTIVVLSHELAHGYTHLGKDIDGNRWDDDAFAAAELEVVEGLAQFYTETVTSRMQVRTPGASMAYKKLLKLQSGPYLAHQDWLKDSKSPRGEPIRFALLAARSRGAMRHEEWLQILAGASVNLKRNPPGRRPTTEQADLPGTG